MVDGQGAGKSSYNENGGIDVHSSAGTPKSSNWARGERAEERELRRPDSEKI